MANRVTFPEDVWVAGNLSAKSMTFPAGAVGNADVAGAAGLAATKLEHQYEPVFNQVHGSAAATERRVIHVVRGATGDLISFKAGVVVANIGAATIDIDLLVNGSSVLSAAIQLDSGDAAYAIVEGTITSATLAVGDVIEVDVTATAGGGTLGQGLFALPVIREDAD